MSIAEANAKIDKALALREGFFRALRKEDVEEAEKYLQEMEASEQYLAETLQIFRGHLNLIA